METYTEPVDEAELDALDDGKGDFAIPSLGCKSCKVTSCILQEWGL